MWPWTPLRTSLVFIILHCSRHVRKRSHKRLLSGGGGKRNQRYCKMCQSPEQCYSKEPRLSSLSTISDHMTLHICDHNVDLHRQKKRKLTVMWLSAKINGLHQQQKKNQIVPLWRLQCTGKTYWLPLEQVYLTLEIMWQRQLLKACLSTEGVQTLTTWYDQRTNKVVFDLSTYNIKSLNVKSLVSALIVLFLHHLQN